MSEATEEAEETQALPGDGLREGIVSALRDDLGDHLRDTHLVPQDDLWVRVSSEAWALTAQALKAQGFDYFCFVSAIDWMPSPYGKGEDNPDDEPKPVDTEIKQGYAGGDTRFQVFARLTDLRRHVGVTIKADVPDSMTMPTWIGSFAGANWHERETHEMFGIGFDGHPDLRNLYLPGEFEGFPLRKDFPLLSRMVKPWPGIVDVEPMPEIAEEVADTAISADGEPLPAEPDDTDDTDTDDTDTDDDDTADVEKTADTAAGDAVEAATAPDVDPSGTAANADESATSAVVDADADSNQRDSVAEGAVEADEEATSPADVERADESGHDADDAIDEADDAIAEAESTDDAVEPDSVDTADADEAPDADPTMDLEPGSDEDADAGDAGPAQVTADLGPGTTTESTDADPEAPTPGVGIADGATELDGGATARDTTSGDVSAADAEPDPDTALGTESESSDETTTDERAGDAS